MIDFQIETTPYPNPAEQAAMMLVVSAIFNLNEALSKT
jgi:hypothetical protein